MRRHIGRAGGVLHIHVGEQRDQDASELGKPLTWPADPKAFPYLDAQGCLVLPLDCPRKFRWWAGGQRVEQTIREIA